MIFLTLLYQYLFTIEFKLYILNWLMLLGGRTVLSSNKNVLKTVENICSRLTKLEKIKRYSMIASILEGKIEFSTDLYKDLLKKQVIYANAKGFVTSVYPFSITQTDKVIEFKNNCFPTLYAMCAIDALGIYYLTGESLTIKSKCPVCLNDITIKIDSEKSEVYSSNSDLRVLHVDLKSSCNWAIECCGQMHFFYNEDYLKEWLLKNGCSTKNYYSLTLEEACAVSQKLFEFQ